MKDEPEEAVEEKPMPQWKLKKMEELAERKKPVVEKSFKVILEGLAKEDATFATIKVSYLLNLFFLSQNSVIYFGKKF